MSLDTSMVSHGEVQFTRDVLEMTVGKLANELKKAPENFPEPKFEYIGNGSPTHVRCYVHVEGYGEFTHTQQGTDRVAMSDAYLMLLLQMLPYTDPTSCHGV